jgi:hypothetical protein
MEEPERSLLRNRKWNWSKSREYHRPLGRRAAALAVERQTTSLFGGRFTGTHISKYDYQVDTEVCARGTQTRDRNMFSSWGKGCQSDILGRCSRCVNNQSSCMTREGS